MKNRVAQQQYRATLSAEAAATIQQRNTIAHQQRRRAIAEARWKQQYANYVAVDRERQANNERDNLENSSLQNAYRVLRYSFELPSIRSLSIFASQTRPFIRASAKVTN
jgi:Rps23 Pro-64 3,4-dihydroxylase Tpa1-like proline 4-hydroxylase